MNNPMQQSLSPGSGPPIAKKQRGGRRVNKMPMLSEPRVGLDDAYTKNYHHPASFYDTYPGVMHTLAEEQGVISSLLGEMRL